MQRKLWTRHPAFSGRTLFYHYPYHNGVLEGTGEPFAEPLHEYILSRCSDVENRPDETLAPYQEFVEEGKTYYFTPGGFLYRKDPGTQEVGGYFCGYLTDEVWHYRTDDS